MRLFAITTLVASLVLPAVAADFEPEAEDIVGAWQLKYTTPDAGDATSAIIVGLQNGEFAAWHMQEGIEKGDVEEVKKVEIKGNSLELTFRPKSRDGQVEVTLTATMEKQNACSGVAKYAADDGETGEFKFTGKRLGEADFDEVQAWKLKFTGPDEIERTPTVMVFSQGEQLFAWYSSEGYELPATNITATDDKVEMSISAQTPDDQTIDVTFTGTVNGDQVKGEAEFDLAGETGTFDFEGSLQ
jgi:hypothetical protein